MQNNALWIASIFGPFLTILGIWMLLYFDNLNKVWQGLKGAPATFSLLGMINILIGLFILSQYDMWEWSAYFFVTLLGWYLLVRGVLILFMPQLVMKIEMSGSKFRKVQGLIPLIWGLILSWLAFFM